jgi:hypothetical protein
MLTQVARRTRLLHKRLIRADSSSTLFMPWQRLSRQMALASNVIEDRLSTITDLMDENMTIAQAMRRLAFHDQGIFYDPVRSVVRAALIAGHSDGSHYRGRLPSSGYVDTASRMAQARAIQVDQQMRRATKSSLRSNSDNQFMFSPGRALRAVRYEAATHYNQGLLTALRGMAVLKEWVTTSDEPCPECLENEDVGRISLSEDFPSGDAAPLLHPNCACVLGIQ